MYKSIKKKIKEVYKKYINKKKSIQERKVNTASAKFQRFPKYRISRYYNFTILLVNTTTNTLDFKNYISVKSNFWYKLLLDLIAISFLI